MPAEREKERDQCRPYNADNYKTKCKKKGAYIFRLFVVKIVSICKARRKGCGKDNGCFNQSLKRNNKEREN
jgi:hypothetical protein